MELNNKKLEETLSKKEEAPKMPREMEIGLHQGALNTLIAERTELVNMIYKVEQIMKMHLERLEQLGVKIQRKEEKK